MSYEYSEDGLIENAAQDVFRSIESFYLHPK